MDYKELVRQFIEDGAWDGVPAIAVCLFAQWLEEREAAEQGVQQTGFASLLCRHGIMGCMVCEQEKEAGIARR